MCRNMYGNNNYTYIIQTMTIEKLHRVIWRLEGLDVVTRTKLTKAIQDEIGTDKRTVDHTIEQLQFRGLLKRLHTHQWKVNKIESDF